MHFNLFDDGDVLAARPDRLYEVRPQPGVLRHTGALFVDFSPVVQIHDIPVPQMGGGEQVVEFMQQFDMLAGAEPVVKVPKISLDRVPKRFPRRRTRKAEQLVEVPTIISYSSLQLSVEQNMDIPVPRVRGGGGGGLPGFRPGQGSSAADVEQIVGIPVPQRRLRRKCSPPGQGSTAYLEQIAGSRARGGPQGFLPGQGSSSSSRFPGGADDGFPGDFRTFFSPGKSAGHGPHPGSELGADFTPSTPAPYVDGDMPPTWIDDEGLTWWQSESGRWYKARDPSIWWDDPG